MLPLADHQTELVPGRESSCLAAGYSAYYQCKVCHDLFDDEGATLPTTEAAHVLSLAAHDLKLVEEKEADCTEKGNIAYYQCSVCKKLFSAEDTTEEIDEESIELDYRPHDLLHHDAVAATCTTSGNIEYWDCRNCGKYFTDEEGTAESETTFAELIIPHGHILQAVSGTAATCTTDGTKAYWTCSTCRKLSRVMPFWFRNALIPLSALPISDRNRCSTDTYSSPSAFASSSAESRTLFSSFPT